GTGAPGPACHHGPVQVPDDTRRRLRAYAPWLLGLGCATLYAAVSLARLHRFASRSWDVAIFEQAIAGYAHLGAPIVAVQGPGANFFGDHFSPALAIFAPAYRLFPHTETLMLGQALLVAVSVVVVARAGTRHLGFAPGLAVGAAYGLSWGVQSAVDFDFHEVAIAAPLLALAGAAYLDRDWLRVALWTLPLILVKEDLALTVAAVGVVLMLSGGNGAPGHARHRGPPGARRWGIGLALAGIVSFAVTTVWIIPAHNAEGSYRFWPQGDDGVGLTERVLGLPADLVSPSVKLVTLLLVVVVTAALALRSPWVLVTVPALVIRFLSDNESYWGTDFHYSLTVMTVVFVALLDAIVRTRADGPDWLRPLAARAPTAAVAVAVALCVSFPFRTLIDPATYDGGTRAEQAAAVLAAVPEGTSVASDIGLLTPLVGERTAYWVGSDLGPVQPDYVVLDAGTWSGPARDGVAYAEQLVPEASYERVLHRGPFQVMRRTDPPPG
ncbi:MAG: DUF2079 domain-containing protein, partial [Actinomycetota bacterium]|nr:DUF2079 domain-containing protein [Actinomycetota bacterium]